MVDIMDDMVPIPGGEFAMGQAVEPVLKAMGVIVLRAEQPSEVLEVVNAAITMAFQSGQQAIQAIDQTLQAASTQVGSMNGSS